MFRFVVRRAADVVAGRSWAKRSLLNVNEHLTNKPDATDAPLSQQNYLGTSLYTLSPRRTSLTVFSDI